MAKDFIGYQALTDAALRGVVRDALRRIEKSGLIGAHHFYLTFKTHAEGVDIPDFLKEQYPDEMTIIIQHQYWALKVKEDFFEVTLTFKKLPAPLHIPFNALTAFFDPGVQFGLQFRAEGESAPRPAAGPVMVAPSEPQAEAETTPDPVIEKEPDLAVPVVLKLPEPVTDNATDWTPIDPTSRLPDPVRSAWNFSPSM